MWGKHHTEETKLKMSAKKKGVKLKKESEYKNSLDRRERIKFRNTMQKIVFEKDDYTCQMCGIKGVDLQVDHIQSWVDYIELRFNINNCRTLCAKCHYQITFGRPMPSEVKGWGHNLVRRQIL